MTYRGRGGIISWRFYPLSNTRRPKELSPDMNAVLTARLVAGSGLDWLRAAGGSAWLPLALLLLALATAFLFGNDRDNFYRTSYHSDLTSDHLAVAGNMAWENGFLGFYRRWQEADGAATYSLYNRFPVGGYLLIKLFILPFEGDFAAQIYSARILMLLAFAAAAVLAYLSLSRLTGQRWIALTATLLTFASPYWLYSNDMVATEIGLDFFGGMLTFHGMVLFAQEGRFRQLLVKSGLALLLGWHVYALIGTFVAAGLAGQIIRGRGLAPEMAIGARIRALSGQLLRSRYLSLGLAALLFGSALLSFNWVNEYRALQGEIGWTELPSFNAMQRRLSAYNREGDSFFPGGGWDYWGRQFHRIGKMTTPYALPGYFNDQGAVPREKFQTHYFLLGLAVTAGVLLGLARARHKRLWATLALSGFGWAVLARYNVAFHYFEAVFYTGLPLAAWSLLLGYLSRSGGRRFVAALAVVAILVFGWSAFQMAQVGYSESVAEVREPAMADIQAIYDITEGRTVAYKGQDPDIAVVVSHYLRRSLGGRPAAAADFLILPLRLEGIPTLTSENRRLFLYPGGAATAGYLDEEILARAGRPLLDSNFAVYRYTDRGNNPPEDWLFYVRAGCSPADQAPRFFLHLTPAEVGHLPPERWDNGFDNRDFSFRFYSWETGERCVAARRLPDYPIAAIYTGQVANDGNLLWAGEIALR